MIEYDADFDGDEDYGIVLDSESDDLRDYALDIVDENSNVLWRIEAKYDEANHTDEPILKPRQQLPTDIHIAITVWQSGGARQFFYSIPYDNQRYPAIGYLKYGHWRFALKRKPN